MQKIIYSESEIALLRSMKHQKCSQIYFDGCCQFAFVFPNRYITGRTDVLAAVTQNDYDEAIRVRFELKSGEYHPSKHDELLFFSCAIEQVWIARTVLYFTDSTPFESQEEATEESIREFPGSTQADKILRELIVSSTGGHSEIVSHPDTAPQEPDFSDEYANLIDAGIILQISERFLDARSFAEETSAGSHRFLYCLSYYNGFALSNLIQSQQELENDEDITSYQLIAV